MAKDFFEAYVVCLLMFLIPIAINIISRIRDYIYHNKNILHVAHDVSDPPSGGLTASSSPAQKGDVLRSLQKQVK